jgi:hypothetical protein
MFYLYLDRPRRVILERRLILLDIILDFLIEIMYFFRKGSGILALGLQFETHVLHASK